MITDIKIDNSAFFNEIGLKNYKSLGKDFAAKGKAAASNATRKYTQKGDKLQKGGKSAIASIAKSNTANSYKKLKIGTISNKPKIKVYQSKGHIVDFVV